MHKKNYYIIDFDSTFVRCEVLEEIAKISLHDNPDKKIILKEIVAICNLGMEGALPFEESLTRRLTLLHANKEDLKKVRDVLKKNITPSILIHKEFFKKNKEQIYVISGAFKECITPITKLFEISDSHVLANTFVFDDRDNIIGIDLQNTLSHKFGKVKAVQALDLKGKLIVVGDGYTDYEIRKEELAHVFVAFTENVRRESVISKADYVAANFDEFLRLISTDLNR
ncbi:hypothetical protein A2334_01780 [Candidatus Roizmanbacteria bacterium RIFOXYB2_FULL_38_10]|uniref:phosphoserine phosphatase n=1 Tax=Candidatus Roizmanbacteria bacterium RIFOXYD1_FULL_38_12 TaxID=1802093 RepID=A0A1F7L1T0_9BACT|nr:MAG: hypothetical protein A3K47_04840 [Candidatus Roizmanbacteria bacterium RIFOXYA2_FULL_38_14]OGK64075.1 MAG: hypothetical protein A3K27_04840 [Candidatus Roizmanbacteria bacterium RIFOXYA1_FULL_37_12]OGK65921.1 MAG: hypothetical protein A3K38_04840 [Candidatus Roizmanbacteria bacterium RIFOXYB1_FULL_40_23]OGK68074.1 MAG: hypothetical protein A2334_01780 [Candidatus Roizmanbacteria bacterium RIFOXYB2_FULL_38_10]OGK70326.1 MAG: hypothetical protein A3K21_04845 [Candidatus Roizmanbacteria ba